MSTLENPARDTTSVLDVLHIMRSREGYRFSHACKPVFFISPVQPAVQGGALLHSGVLVALTNCTFEWNMAGEDGLAVMSLGLVNNMKNLTFQNNSFFCTSGKYGLEEGSDEVEVWPFPSRCTHFMPKK